MPTRSHPARLIATPTPTPTRTPEVTLADLDILPPDEVVARLIASIDHSLDTVEPDTVVMLVGRTDVAGVANAINGLPAVPGQRPAKGDARRALHWLVEQLAAAVAHNQSLHELSYEVATELDRMKDDQAAMRRLLGIKEDS